jgi:hypothetical protein
MSEGHLDVSAWGSSNWWRLLEKVDLLYSISQMKILVKFYFCCLKIFQLILKKVMFDFVKKLN